MSKSLKILALVLVAVLSVAVFAGCRREVVQGSSAVETQSDIADVSNIDSQASGQEDENSSKVDNTPGNEEEVSSTTSNAGSVGSGRVQVNKTGWPIVNEKISFEIMGKEAVGYADPDSMSAFKYYEKKTNIHIDFVGVPSGQVGTRKALVLQSKDWPDAFRFDNTTFSDVEISKYGSEGAFVDVSKLVKTYAPNISELLENKANYATNVAEDGKIYTIPHMTYTGRRSANWHNTYNHWLNINTEWLEELGLDIPTTTDEFRAVLEAFRDADPNGNGTQDEIPYADFAWSANFITAGWGVYGATGNTGGGIGIDNKGKAYYNIITEEAHQATKYWHSIRNSSGLMDNSIIANQKNDYAAFKTLIKSGKVGAFRWSGLGSASFDPKLLEKYTPIPYPDAPSITGSSLSLNATCQPLTAKPIRGCLIITKACKNVPALLRYYDYLMTDDGIMLMNWGTEEAGLYKKNSNGTYKLLTNDSNKKKKEGLSWYFGVPEWPMAKVDRSSLGNDDAYYAYIEKADQLYYDAHKKSPTYYLPEVMKTADEIRQLKLYEKHRFTEIHSGTLGNYIINYTAGNGYGIDNWTTWVQNMEKNGINNYVKLWQKIVDRNKAYIYKSSDVKRDGLK